MGVNEKQHAADVPDGMSMHDGVSVSLDHGSDILINYFLGIFRVHRRDRKPVRYPPRLEITSYPATRHFWSYWYRPVCWNFKRLEQRGAGRFTYWLFRMVSLMGRIPKGASIVLY